jgi:hypothetical protein
MSAVPVDKNVDRVVPAEHITGPPVTGSLRRMWHVYDRANAEGAWLDMAEWDAERREEPL